MKVVFQIRNTLTNEFNEEVFDRLPILIGRSKICDLVLNDTLASRQHCVLESTETGELRLVDLQSANGTFFNGKKISKQSLSVGDHFKVGDSEISLEKIVRAVEESTVHDLTPVEERKAPEKTGTILQSRKKEAVPPATPEPGHLEPVAAKQQEDELSLRTPVVFKSGSVRPVGKTKDWVQVSLFWKDELIEIKCFERGDVVFIGTEMENDFVVQAPSLPKRSSFLKILPQGLEMYLHFSMSGNVETRKGVQSLEDLRKLARQTENGPTAFIPFEDRCLIEIGPFTLFIQAVRLRLIETLEATLVKEPLFSGILSSVAVAFILFLVFIGNLSAIRDDKTQQQTPVVKLEAPNAPKPKIKRVPPPVHHAAKAGVHASKRVRLAGKKGAGAKAKGPSGKRGKKHARSKAKIRSIGFRTKHAPPKRVLSKGAFGKEKNPALAKRGHRADQGVGTGRPRPRGSGHQLPTKTVKPKVRVEDEGILGVLEGSGGGGHAKQGGNLEGSGLGGNLRGALAGLERGSAERGRGNGGRGNEGKEFGSGGSSLNVGGLGTKGKGGGRSSFGLGSSGVKGEADVSYIAEEVEVRDGLTRAEIERVVRAHENEIRACYEKSLIQSGNANLAGRLKINWFVDRSGKAINVKQLSSFGAQAGLFGCVARRVRAWQFPEPRGGSGAQVSWPFVFRKGG